MCGKVRHSLEAFMLRPAPRRSGFTLVELSIVALIISLLAALAFTEFSTFLSRSKRAEVQANLRALSRVETMYEQDNRAFSPYPGVLGFAPERHNRYAYVLRDGCTSFQDRSGQAVVSSPTQVCIGVDTFSFGGAAAIPPTP